MTQSSPAPDELVFRRVDLGEVTLNVGEAGPCDGPVVILLHGFPESAAGWHRQVGPLARAGFRVIVPDQRGYGLSDKPERIEAYHLDRLAADVVALGRACGAERFCLAGHDWGGLVAWWVASFHPEQVIRLAILNAPHPGIVAGYIQHHPGQWLRSLYVGFFQLRGFAERWLTADDAKALRRALVSTSRKGTFSKADLDAYAREWTRSRAMTAMLSWYRALVRLPRRDPPRVTMPTLILWGKRDHALQPGLAEASLRLCDSGRIRWFPDTTHWVQHEEPEAVSSALESFFQPIEEPRIIGSSTPTGFNPSSKHSNIAIFLSLFAELLRDCDLEPLPDIFVQRNSVISLRTSLAAGLVLGALFAGSAQAAPAPVQPGLGQDGLMETVAMHRHHRHRMHRHHSTRHERRMRRMNTMRHGDPNARNPQQPGYKQQLGNTTGGPRY